MRLIVQKYGGTSVGTPERIRAVAQRLIDTQRDNCRVVAAISAMAGVTDNLIKLADGVSPNPTHREMDILLATGEHAASALTAMAVNALGGRAISLTGAQAGILTDGVHTRAKIANITPRQIHELLADDYIVIVAGFQGQTAEGETTTLGRGGTDLTAIALAGALEADACQIFTDVDGVFTCDPRVVAEAKKIDEIAYDELLEMAGAGSKVMQSRAVEFAKKFGIPFEVRSSFKGEAGTISKEQTPNMEDVVVRGVSVDRKQAKVTIAGVPDRAGIASRIFSADRFRQHHRRHDRAKCFHARHHRHFIYNSRGRPETGEGIVESRRHRNRRDRSHHAERRREAKCCWNWNALSLGRRCAPVSMSGPGRNQHPADLDFRHQDRGHHRRERLGTRSAAHARGIWPGASGADRWINAGCSRLTIANLIDVKIPRALNPHLVTEKSRIKNRAAEILQSRSFDAVSLVGLFPLRAVFQCDDRVSRKTVETSNDSANKHIDFPPAFFGRFGFGRFNRRFAVTLQPRVQAFQFFRRQLLEAGGLEFAGRHHLLNVAGFLLGPRYAGGKKNSGEGYTDTANEAMRLATICHEAARLTATIGWSSVRPESPRNRTQ